MQPAEERIIVLGLGSEILTDDGLPLRLIRDLKKELNIPGITYRDANTGGLDLLDHLDGFDKAVIIDTIMTRDGKPGTVYTFTPEKNYRESLHLSSYHDAAFPVALRLGSVLELDMPDELWIIAVEVVEGLEFGANSSRRIQAGYPLILEEVSRAVSTIVTETVYSVL